MKKFDKIEGSTIINKTHINFLFTGQKLILYFGFNFFADVPEEIMEETIIIGKKTDNKLILFSLSHPIKTWFNGIKSDSNSILGNLSLVVDFFIDNYNCDCKGYSKMLFEFNELNYFLPSKSLLNINSSESKWEIDSKSKTINKFEFTHMNRIISFELSISAVLSCRESCKAQTKTRLILSFDDTSDFEFIIEMHRVIFNLFCFICNRKNISLNEVVLCGEHIVKHPKCRNRNEVEERQVTKECNLYVINRYKEKEEFENILKNTPTYCFFSNKLPELFNLICKDLISLTSIPASNNLRNLIDLRQTLQLTSGFEFYFRTHLPEIKRSQATILVYEEIKKLIDVYISENKGKKKHTAKQIAKQMLPKELSFKEKLCKVYKGYNGWNGLNSILEEKFGQKILPLATMMNDWRNEHAHEKRTFEITQELITAVRLVEHVNYCIILRKAGYCDNEIRNIIKIVFC